ncbi:MAG: hypothetical protein ACK4TA_12200 [Saprospiraceae bacterium]
MELQILISKKGTKVVTATNLHQALQLLDHHYSMNIKKWITDIFEFRDGIRKPVKMQDFAPRSLKDAPLVEDYYLSVEFAKLIALRSKSKVKLKYAKWLQSLDEAETQSPDFLSHDQVLAVLDLVKVMTSISTQEEYERQHLKLYEERNGGSASNWWQHRAQILGYSSEELREKVLSIGKRANRMSQRQLLMHVDKYEMIRIGVIDLFMVLGKTEAYARSMGDLAKTFARELQVEIKDDRYEERNLFAPFDDTLQTVHDLQAVERAFRISA